MTNLHDRLRGGLFGLLIGDAVGVPYEFHRPDELPPRHALDLVPPADFDRAHSSVPPGTWSDDGALALALLDSLLDCNKLDPRDLGRRIVAWCRNGVYAVDGRVFDVGRSTRSAINRLESGMDPLAAGLTGEGDNGNGSLMRTLPLALWHRGDDAELVRDAMVQSKLTHAHPRSQVCCALYALWARRVLHAPPASATASEAGNHDSWASAVADLQHLLTERPDRDAAQALRELERNVLTATEPTGRGYVVDSLVSTRHVLAAGGYEEVVRSAIALGHDTDTTACLAGGLAGLRDGEASIPERWREGLRGRELAESLAERLLARWPV